jgi:hypothetical protein
MKMKILLSTAIIAGLLMTTGKAYSATEDTLELKKPVKVENLPEAVRETVQKEYEDYRILEAYHVTGSELSGPEGVRHEGTGQAGLDRGETEQTGTRYGGQAGTRQDEREAGTMPDDEPERPGGLYTDSVDSWYELKLAKGQESKIIMLTAEGDELETRSDNDDL